MSALVWIACECYVWPCSPLAPASRCGLCRTKPFRLVEAPSNGKARPLCARS